MRKLSHIQVRKLARDLTAGKQRYWCSNPVYFDPGGSTHNTKTELSVSNTKSSLEVGFMS